MLMKLTLREEMVDLKSIHDVDKDALSLRLISEIKIVQ